MKVTPRSMLLRSITASVVIVLSLLIVMPGSTGTRPLLQPDHSSIPHAPYLPARSSSSPTRS